MGRLGLLIVWYCHAQVPVASANSRLTTFYVAVLLFIVQITYFCEYNT